MRHNRRATVAHLRAQATLVDKQAWNLEQLVTHMPCLAETGESLGQIVTRLRRSANRIRRMADRLQPARPRPARLKPAKARKSR